MACLNPAPKSLPTLNSQRFHGGATANQHSTRTLEEIPDLRIPEEYLPIEPTQQIPLPPSPPIFRNWVIDQISHARELFQKQNYMQALVVIDKAKDHEYMRELSTNRSLASNVTRHHLQDLYLVEFCCRLVCSHESQMGSIDVVKMLEYLNTSVLGAMRTFQTRSRIEYKTTFRRQEDPLVDYTLAILTRSWNQLLPPELESQVLMSEHLSAEQTALASASLPFLRAVMSRRLFPSDTSILIDVTTAVSPCESNPRRTALEICLSSGDQMSAMHWMWLWDRHDRKDWLSQWNQLEIRQWLVAHLLRNGQPDWAIDLLRLGNKAAGTPNSWIQDLVTSLSLGVPSASTREDSLLARILHLLDVDTGAFPEKGRYYALDSWKPTDHLLSWLSSLQDLTLVFQHEYKHSVEQRLWREIAMVGVLSKKFVPEDVIRSVSPEVLAVIKPPQPPLQHRTTDSVFKGSSSSDLYRDALTDYLEEKATRGLDITSEPVDQKSLTEQGTLEASLLLKRAIQEVMSPYHTEDASAQQLLCTYKDLLHNVAHNAAIRSGHLGLISQVTEARFRALYGDGPWSQTTAAFQIPVVFNRHLLDHTWKDSRILSTPDVQNFVSNHMRYTLAKICASTVEVAGSPIERWDGRLSNWFITLAETSEATGHMARNIQCQARLLPGSQAYDLVLSALLESQELDLASTLHSRAYGLFDIKDLSSSLDASITGRQPGARELRMLIHGLASSEKDPMHLEQAQWIFEQHVVKEKALVRSGFDNKTSPLVNIVTVTELTGAWFRRAEFTKARKVIETMWERGILPNMIMYNTLLKALVDLTPYSKAGGRTMGGGKQSGMRERGREIMVRQLLKSREASGDTDAGFEEAITKRVRSELDDGWDLFQSIISNASEQTARTICLPVAKGLDSPAVLKSLISQTVCAVPSLNLAGQDDGQFRPNSHTFSILLGAFARRGEIESISELFVEMKQLNLEPDVVICTILANAFAKKGDLRAVDRVIQEARNRNLDPGLYLANIVLDSLVEAGVSASRISETLDGMIAGASEIDAQHNLDDEAEIPVRRLGGAQAHHHQSNPQKRFRDPAGRTQPSTPPLSRQLYPERGLDAVTLTTLIKYHTRKNDLDSAQDILRLMVQAGAVPDSRVYAMLLATCIRKWDIASGISTLRAMRVHSNELPDAKAWKGLLRCALELELAKASSSAQRRRRRGLLSEGGASSGSQKKQREGAGAVMLVLQELSSVLDEIERAKRVVSVGPRAAGSGGVAANVVPKVDSSLAARDYLYRILTTSWLSVSSSKDDGTDNYSDDKSPKTINPEIKGKNGLLRRVLNHLLREPGTRKTSTVAAADVKPEDADSKDSRDQFPWQTEQQHQQPAIIELEVEVERRCEQAIWLVRLVEASGIELGPRWKWDVVVKRIQTLTERNPEVIVKQLERRA
ncbi:hypothetical protein BGZ58_000402 [Dissophora ornata]|nr:hypothetical protein BGZ58_000402 [Dissophora ornata]